MKFTLNQKDLLVPLKHVYGVAEHSDRTRSPILAHTLIRAESGENGERGTVAFEACDDAVLFESEELENATVEEAGEATVEAHRLHDLIHRIPADAEVHVSLESAKDARADDADGADAGPADVLGGDSGKRVVIKAAGSTYRLPSLAADDFQKFEDKGEKSSLSLSAAAVRGLINACRVSMSDDEARLHLNGIYLHTEAADNKTWLRAAATDGHRLACATEVVKDTDGLWPEDGITLPRKAVAQVDELLRDVDDKKDVKLRSGDTLFEAKVGRVTMKAQLAKGRFPDYRRVIPEPAGNRLTVNRQALLRALDRLSAVADPKSRGILLEARDATTLILRAGTPTAGLGRERIEAQYEGEALSIGFNGDYATACCRVIPDEDVVFEFKDSEAAATVRGASGEAVKHVVMPLSVSTQGHAALLELADSATDAAMRFTLGRGTLLPPLTHLRGVVEKVGTRPIYSHALLRAEDGHVVLDAGDNQVLYETERLPAQVEVPGTATVDASLFHGVVGKLDEDADVRVSLVKGGGGGDSDGSAWIAVEAGACTFMLPSLPAEDFPTLGGLEWEQSFEMPAADLRLLLGWGRLAMSADPARMYLNGVFLHTVESEGGRLLRSGATDGHRLSQAECQCPPDAPEVLGEGVTLPSKAVDQIDRLLTGAEGAVRIGTGNGWMRLEIADVIVITRLHESKFPDYQRVIPTSCTSILTVDRAHLQKALDRLALVVDRKSRAVRFDLNEETRTASARDSQHGAGREQIEGSFRGPPVVIGFNSEYLSQLCQAAWGDEMVLEFQSASQPVLIRDTGEAGRLHVLLPLRV